MSTSSDTVREPRKLRGERCTQTSSAMSEVAPVLEPVPGAAASPARPRAGAPGAAVPAERNQSLQRCRARKSPGHFPGSASSLAFRFGKQHLLIHGAPQWKRDTDAVLFPPRPATFRSAPVTVSYTRTPG